MMITVRIRLEEFKIVGLGRKSARTSLTHCTGSRGEYECNFIFF